MTTLTEPVKIELTSNHDEAWTYGKEIPYIHFGRSGNTLIVL